MKKPVTTLFMLIVAVISGSDELTSIFINNSNNNNMIFLEKTDIKIISIDEYKYEFQIINNDKINLFEEINNPIVLFKNNGKIITAKGHPGHSSLYPPDSEYYFHTTPNGKAIFIYGNENIFTIHKINKEIYFDNNRME